MAYSLVTGPRVGQGRFVPFSPLRLREHLPDIDPELLHYGGENFILMLEVMQDDRRAVGLRLARRVRAARTRPKLPRPDHAPRHRTRCSGLRLRPFQACALRVPKPASATGRPTNHLASAAGGNRMRTHARLACTPRQYHAAPPHECIVCRLPFLDGAICTHEETGARTCSALCFTRYQRWWLRPRPRAAAVPPHDAEAR